MIITTVRKKHPRSNYKAAWTACKRIRRQGRIENKKQSSLILHVYLKGYSFCQLNMPQRTSNPFFLGYAAAIVLSFSEKVDQVRSEVVYRRDGEDQCFDHRNCSVLEFCGWAQCQSNGIEYSCGRCMPCSMCICNSNSVDFECPRNQCPDQPVYGVLFWQGIFYSTTDLQSDPNFKCVRRLAIVGNSFSMLQVPVSKNHPASSATMPTPNSTDCFGHSRSGVLKGSVYKSQGQYTLSMAVTSEGKRGFKM